MMDCYRAYAQSYSLVAQYISYLLLREKLP